MSVLNNFPAMPNRIAIACEYLYYLGPDGELRDNIETQLSPLKKADSDEIGSGKTMAEDVLNEMDKLGFLTQVSAGKITLMEDIRNISSPQISWQQLLRPILRQRLTFPDLAEKHRQEEIPDAIAWLLAQDPFDPLPFSGGIHATRVAKQLGENDPLRSVIGNNSRYQNLIYWARYLGFAEWVAGKAGNVVIPDPTYAISECLARIFDKEGELAILTFVQRMSDAFPVLEEGSARRNLEMRLAGEFQRKDQHLSRSTSLALMRLQLRGKLSLRTASDAQTWILDLGKETKAVSHVRLIGEATI